MKRVFLLIYSISLLSCSKCLLQEIPVTDEELRDNSEMIRSYSKILATSLSDLSIRKLIKDEAQKQFDGDYDILIRNFNEMPVPIGTRDIKVKEFLTGTYLQMRSSDTEGMEELLEMIDNLQSQIPNLQISVPVCCENWNVDEYIPLVTYLPCDYTEDSYIELEAFDNEGNIYTLSAIEEPQNPVIVVSVSERVNNKGEFIYDSNRGYTSDYFTDQTRTSVATPTGFNLLHSTAGALSLSWDAISSDGYYEIWRRAEGENTFSLIHEINADENYYKDTGLIYNETYNYRIRLVTDEGTSPYTSIISTTSSERNIGDPLKLVYYQMTRSQLINVERWVHGRPELNMRVFYYDALNSQVKELHNTLLRPTRNHIKGGCNPNETITASWNPNVIGPMLMIAWIEIDGVDDNTGSDETEEYTFEYEYEDNTQENPIVVSGSSTIVISNLDVPIGNTCVYWWNPKSTVFTSGISWKLD